MNKNKGYRSKPLDFTRRMVIASVNSNKKNAIHCLTEFDVSIPRTIIREHFQKTGEKISFTAYIARCFAECIKEFPEMNSFLKGNKLIILDDITISILIEREIEGNKVPEPLGIKKIQEKTIRTIHNEIRKAQQHTGKAIGDLSESAWIRFIPSFLIRTFIRIAERNISMAKRYGKIAITSVGMYSNASSWFIPHGTAMFLLTIGSIRKETIQKEDGTSEIRELLHITASFDHEIIDGSPAARFMNRFDDITRNASF